jgi:hypothetical protein
MSLSKTTIILTAFSITIENCYTALTTLSTKHSAMLGAIIERETFFIVMLGAIMMNVVIPTVAVSRLVLTKSIRLMLAKGFYCHSGCHYDECH